MNKKSAFKSVMLGIASFSLSLILCSCGLFAPSTDPKPPAKVTVVINPTEISMEVGDVSTAVAAASDGSKIEWISSVEDVATVENGVITAISAGTTDIIATCGKALGKCAVTVTEKKVTPPSGGDDDDEKVTVTISAKSLTLYVGGTHTLTATASDGSAITWRSGDESVVTVYGGRLQAKKAGRAVILAVSGKSVATCEVTVAEAPAKPTVTLSATYVTVAAGRTCKLTATVSDGSSVTWRSENTDIATVENGVVTGVAAGKTAVYATCGEISAKCEVSVTTPTPIDPDTPEITPPAGYTLVWNDEFNGASLDMSRWSYQTGTKDSYNGAFGPDYWGNSELQYYTEGDNVSVSGGALKITAKRERRGDRDYTSSRIVTRDKATWTFGYMEARMKLPKGDGMWPAFWMLPQPSHGNGTNNEYGGWAANGEIDIMEAKGRLNNKVDTTIHFGGPWPQNTYLTHETTLSSDIDEWHTYALEWTAEYIAWIIDGTEAYRLTADRWYSTASSASAAPFDKPFYILFNFAVGGSYDPTGTNNMVQAGTFTSADMLVDYVRVFQKTARGGSALNSAASIKAPEAILASRER